MRIGLINPNTTNATTTTMVRIARGVAPGVEVVGFTAPRGCSVILGPAGLATASEVVLEMAGHVEQCQPNAVIVAAFGDPGRADLERRLRCPVVGLAEASMLEAAGLGHRFAVVTTTPDLVPVIAEAAIGYGHRDRFVGTWVTPGDPATVMADPSGMLAALEAACQDAIVNLDADVVIIGGGPLSEAAEELKDRLPLPIVQPVPSALALAMDRARQPGVA